MRDPNFFSKKYAKGSLNSLCLGDSCFFYSGKIWILIIRKSLLWEDFPAKIFKTILCGKNNPSYWVTPDVIGISGSPYQPLFYLRLVFVKLPFTYALQFVDLNTWSSQTDLTKGTSRERERTKHTHCAFLLNYTSFEKKQEKYLLICCSFKYFFRGDVNKLWSVACFLKDSISVIEIDY